MKNNLQFKASAHTGFTLVEMSIVLVIIALVVGGVLVGRDMIKNAETRSVMNQLASYKIAMHTFEGKYGAMPGDMLGVTAAKFGFATRTATDYGQGDGNGVIQASYHNNARYVDLGGSGEINLFWNDLGVSGLIDERFSGWDCNWYTSPNCINSAITTIMPGLKVNKQIFVSVWGDPTTGINYFYLPANITSVTQGGQWAYTGNLASFTPLQAFGLDSKLDDGLPLGGLVQAMRTSGFSGWMLASPSTPAAPANGVCVSNATDNPYNMNSSTGGDRVACLLQVQID